MTVMGCMLNTSKSNRKMNGITMTKSNEWNHIYIKENDE